MCLTRVHGQLTPWIPTTGSEARGDILLLGYIPLIHMYLWSVQVHVVGGTDQGVAQLQQESFQTLRPKSPWGDLSGIYCNQRCWMDKNRVGQSISPSFVFVGSNPLADS